MASLAGSAPNRQHSRNQLKELLEAPLEDPTLDNEHGARVPMALVDLECEHGRLPGDVGRACPCWRQP